MMVSAKVGAKLLKEYKVNLMCNGFDVLRTITITGYSKQNVIDKLNIEYFNDDEVVGFQIKEVR